MQKLALSALLAGATISVAQAQTKERTVLLSGSIGYSSGKTENTTTAIPGTPALPGQSSGSSIAVGSQAGFFIADNLVVGLNAGLSSGKNNYSQDMYTSPGIIQTSATKETLKRLSFGPFVRYYHMVGEKAGFYGQLSGGYQRSTEETTGDPPFFVSRTTKGSGGYASILPGFVYFPTAKLGLELTLGSLSYTKITSTSQVLAPARSEGKSTSSNFAANFGLQNLTLGASFHLGN
ncbi:hypothetical protein [Hymenobacter algoricola]